jgi:hypothetical protein
MASSDGIRIRHALPLDTYFGGRVFSGSWSFVLVANHAVFTEPGKAASLVHGVVPLLRYAAL